jgi:hypothetical protein
VTTDDVLAVVKERGLEVVLRPDGRPALRGPGNLRQEATERLLRVLRLPVHRETILARLRPAAPRQWLWRSGHRFTETEPSSFDGGHPTGAWWWRPKGDSCWRPVPDTPGETTDPPGDA